MYIIPIAWLYVTMMMAVAEATSSNGTVLGAMVTFVLYGALPVALVVYLMRAPARRRAIRAREALPHDAMAAQDGAPVPSGSSVNASGDPDAGGHAPAGPEGDSVAPVRKKP